jgi:lipopolysaccharide transport system ATP-binding protein
MMTGQIEAQGLGKSYKTYRRRWHRLSEWLSFGHLKKHTPFWVFHDLTFKIAPGEAVGIIGRNGAGKSTLLKLITAAAYPTSGSVKSTGRVAALLELGMGFHPHFTGRQNVQIAGQLLGFSRHELEAKMPEIEEFAEIGPYLDKPLRTYSSGMQVRLAFSIATAIRPDILIVDEALSVGDAYFQHKCFARIREFKSQGTTLLFVSHDPAAVKSLCDRCLLISDGRIAFEGSPEDAFNAYNAILSKPQAHTPIELIPHAPQDGKFRSGTHEVTVTSVDVTALDGNSKDVFDVGETAIINLRTEVQQPIDTLVAGILFKDRVGNEIFGTNTYFHDLAIFKLNAGDKPVFSFRVTLNLGPGTYSITISLSGDYNHLEKSYDWTDRAAFVRVANQRSKFFVGTSHLPTTVEAIECRALSSPTSPSKAGVP